MTERDNVKQLFIGSTKLMQIFHISRSHLFNLVKNYNFPPAIKIGRVCRWRISDVEKWIAEQKQAMINEVNTCLKE